MKKVLLIGLILAICILAMPQGVMALQSTKNATVNANVVQALTFTATRNAYPSGLEWALTSGTDNLYPAAVRFQVVSTSAWTVVAWDNEASGRPGHMVEWTTAPAWGPRNISAAFRIRGDVGPTLNNIPVVSGSAVQVDHDIKGTFDRSVTGFGQVVNTVDDERLATGSYRIVVTFLCANTF